MKTKIARWLLIGIACILVSACGASKPAVTAQALPCPRPLAPVMRSLDPAEAVCSKRNETAKAANASALRAYAEGLEAAVGCYEAQTSGAGPGG